MKKRVFAAVMIIALMIASVMGVSAADSKKAEVSVSNKSEADTYVIDELNDEVVTAIGGQTVIEQLNESDVSVLPDTIASQLEGKTIIWEMFDLSVASGEHQQCKDQGYHEVTLVVDSLTDKIDKASVRILHYTGSAWEVITPESVDLANKTIVAHFTSLSPIAIYADVVEEDATGTSPSTVGTSSTWMIWAALAVVVLGAGVVVSQKKSR